MVVDGTNTEQQDDGQKMIHLPETLIRWPWPRLINPHFDEVNAESSAWFRSFNAFTKVSQRTFEMYDVGAYRIIRFDFHLLFLMSRLQGAWPG
jgi:hypothetical protein